MGLTETAFVAGMTTEQRRESFERLLEYPVPGLIITRGLVAFPECLEAAQAHGRTVLRTKAQTSAFMSALIGSLYNYLAPRITRSGVMRRAPLAMRLRANSTWAMLEFVFNGMVFLLLGLQLPGIMESSLIAAEADPNVEVWMLFTDIVLIYLALMLVRFGWLWTMKKFSVRFLTKKPMEFGSWTTRELLIASFAGVRGAITLAGVLSIPLLLPTGDVFPARYELVFLAAGVILFSLFVGVIMLPILLQHIDAGDSSQQHKEERIARAATAEVAIVAIEKMEERLAADAEENIDNQLLKEVSSRVIGNLRRRADGRNDVESSLQEENLERRFRLAALRSERAELYHLRATRQISNETLQKLLHDLDLLEALLIENQ